MRTEAERDTLINAAIQLSRCGWGHEQEIGLAAICRASRRSMGTAMSISACLSLEKQHRHRFHAPACLFSETDEMQGGEIEELAPPVTPMAA